MDSNENRVDLPEKAQQIQLVLNNPEDEEDTIDLGKVFQIENGVLT